ncbi:MAG: zinc-ribbon domain-containing protein [Bacilli bacterium]|nr:zinc-ribbon domain-containing protein [Bacilli bacterium]
MPKYCSNCGAELHENDSFCASCGAKIDNNQIYMGDSKKKEEGKKTLRTVALVFMIINTVIFGFALIPLAWMIPMCIHVNEKLKTGEEISIGFKICTLLFCSTIAGILLLVDDLN